MACSVHVLVVCILIVWLLGVFMGVDVGVGVEDTVLPVCCCFSLAAGAACLCVAVDYEEILSWCLSSPVLLFCEVMSVGCSFSRC